VRYSYKLFLRPDLVNDTYGLRRKIQIMKGSFSCDVNTRSFSTTKHVHGVGGRQVHNVTVLSKLVADINHRLDGFVLELAWTTVQEGRVLCGLLQSTQLACDLIVGLEYYNG